MFSRAQQGHFRKLVARAWAKTAIANGWDAKDKSASRKWYEEQLDAATGKTSSIECDARRDFEKAMSHFEAIVGDSFYWTHRIFGSDKRRILHSLQKLASDADFSEDYMRSIARRTLRRDLPPQLDELSFDELSTVLVSLKVYVRRHLRDDAPIEHAPEPPTTGEVDPENIPF